jgi:hypothetical protein
VGNLVGAEKGTEEEFSLALGKVRQERVQDADVFPESKPASPGTVAVFIRLRLNRVIDDSVIRSACSTKDKISSGSGEIAKRWGMSCGKEEWNRLVRRSLAGLSKATGFVFPSRVWVVKESQSEIKLLPPLRC